MIFFVSNFFVFNFFWKKYALQKKVYWSILCSFGSSIATYFFLANIPYFNFQINFQSSYLTKKETEDASKRLSCYCTEALNCGGMKLAQRNLQIYDRSNHYFEIFFFLFSICNVVVSGENIVAVNHRQNGMYIIIEVRLIASRALSLRYKV